MGKRPIYRAQDRIPDGLKVAKNAYVVTGAGYGVNVLEEEEVALYQQISGLRIRPSSNGQSHFGVWYGNEATVEPLRPLPTYIPKQAGTC